MQACIFLIYCIILLFNHNLDAYISIKPVKTTILQNETKIMHICWIFDKNGRYQVLISLGSIIKSNPGRNFIFYFIIPPNETIDLFKYSLLVPKYSKLIVKHFQDKHAYIPKRAKMKCIWTGIIAVKFHLREILPEIDKVLYLDVDIINVAPVYQLWDFPMNKKTFAGTRRVFYKKVYHVNSGVILYNLKFLREQSERLWICANKKLCPLDDYWHSHCLKKSRAEIPYRYDVEFSGMVLFKNITKLQLDEESKVVFYHLKDHYHRFYRSKSIADFHNFTIIQNNTRVLKIFEKLFKIADWVNNEVATRSNEFNRNSMEN